MGVYKSAYILQKVGLDTKSIGYNMVEFCTSLVAPREINSFRTGKKPQIM